MSQLSVQADQQVPRAGAGHSQLVVLGGGPGGYAAAFLAADKGMEVTLVDADSRLGGTCLLRGCIPSKALLHVARVIEETRELDDWGVQFGPAQVELDRLRARKEKLIRTLSGGLAQLAKQRKVRRIQAQASFLNSTTLRLNPVGEKEPELTQLSFDYCIVATGSVPLKVPALAIDSPRVMDSTDALELPEVPDSLLVVGGGYIGLELGTVYRALGSRVSVVELTDGLLPGMDPDLVAPLAKRLRKQLEAIYLKTRVLELKDRGEAVEVVMEGPEGIFTKSYDRVLVSIGRKPNTASLGLENTQVQLDSRGFIQVNQQMRTADPHILAIGDCVGNPMLAHKAAHEGKVAVEALLGEPAAMDTMAIPAVVFTDPEVAWVGYTEAQAAQAGRQIEVARYPWAASGKAQSLGRTEGMTKLVVDALTQRVLGVGIVGPHAGDLISEAALAIELGCTVRDLAETIHPHPTLSETVAFAAEMILGTATEIYRPRRKGAAK